MSDLTERPMSTALSDILNEPGWENSEYEMKWFLTSDHFVRDKFNPYVQSVYVQWNFESDSWELNDDFLIDGWTSLEALTAFTHYLVAVKEACKNE